MNFFITCITVEMTMKQRENVPVSCIGFTNLNHKRIFVETLLVNYYIQIIVRAQWNLLIICIALIY